MKKTIDFLIMPLLAGYALASLLHNIIPHSALLNMDMLNGKETETAFYLMGFLFGFLPLFIYSYAVHTLTALRAGSTAGEPATQAPAAPQPAPYFVGQTFTSLNANCSVRIKRIKNPLEVLQAYNELLPDYM